VDHARILLVDDYRDAADMWALYLRTLGFAVDTVGDGLSAVQVATTTSPDVIVMDLVLPGISGCEAARRIHAFPATARIPIIATTGSTHPLDLRRARAAGFDAIMIKPCDPPGLVAEIDRALSMRTMSMGHPMPVHH
jgi:CheY-like chemotaxis protein